ncbi:MAG: SMI1/KNR4 family protein [Planctomycetales bacterium]|nr:SMI1/KNR4 family protein [Planctomycetales bacterium]
MSPQRRELPDFAEIESLMDSASIIAEWKQRLVALADHPAYVFRDTPQHLIDEHYHRLTSFLGFSEEDVASAEERWKIRFPEVFRRYLLEMAKSPGDLFRGSDLVDIVELGQFRRDAEKLLGDSDPPLELPTAAVVFLMHHGYTFLSILAAGGFDGPVMQWRKLAATPRQVARTFGEMVNAELRLMEKTNRKFRERGGYILTLFPGGGGSMEF